MNSLPNDTVHQFAAHAILGDRRIAYAVVNRRLNIVEAGGAPGLMRSHLDDWLGKSLLEAAPELLGSEAALAEMLAGSLPRLHIPLINRVDPEGRTLYYSLIILPQRDPAGAIQGLLYFIQDVTELGQVEQRVMQQRNELLLLRDELNIRNRQLEAANTELHRMDEVKSAFVSIAAHELRTPLASINGYLEMLLDGDAGPLASRQIEWLRIIEDSARRLLRITSDLLDVSRLEAGHLELVMQPADLAAIVKTVAAEQSPQLDARAQRLRLHVLAQAPLALCDVTRAAQIIGNLLSNASKYSPSGSVITVSLAPAADPGFIQVSVADQGPGIPPGHQTRLFAPFYRLPTEATSGVSGAGLGLYIARALVELHGGRIWFDSIPGHGATFHVTFPQMTAPGELEHSHASFLQ